jgi:hypothetical protein
MWLKKGLVTLNVWGGVERKKYILGQREWTAFFDYDNDGWLDIT